METVPIYTRVPQEVHAKLAALAERDGVSLAMITRQTLEKACRDASTPTAIDFLPPSLSSPS